MDIVTIFVFLLILIVAIIIVSRPFFFTSNDVEETIEGSDGSKFEEGYKQVLAQIRDLEFESGLGKVSPEDHEILLGEYQRRAAVLLEQIEKSRAEKTPIIDESQIPEVEKMITDRKMQRSERSAGFCANCGNSLQKSDRFCPKCGTRTDG